MVSSIMSKKQWKVHQEALSKGHSVLWYDDLKPKLNENKWGQSLYRLH